MNKVLLGVAALAIAATALIQTSQAEEQCENSNGVHPFYDVPCYGCHEMQRAAENWTRQRSQSLPWHNAYYHAAYGEPYALVVPPTAEFQSNYGWGVGGTRVSPIYHQFARPYPGNGAAISGTGFLPTPAWPSDTQQFGVYYIRGPW